MDHVTYFADADETQLAESPAAALRCIRKALQASTPSNVDANATWWRGEGPGGGDLVIPHREFDGFAIIVSVGNVSKSAAIGYASYTRRDRGDPFDAAIDRGHELVATVRLDGDFCDDLRSVLFGYVRRRLCVVQQVRRGGGAALETRILWRTDADDQTTTLWRRRHGIKLLQLTEEKKWSTAFDETSPP
jgi:hypothetical protein